MYLDVAQPIRIRSTNPRHPHYGITLGRKASHRTRECVLHIGCSLDNMVELRPGLYRGLSVHRSNQNRLSLIDSSDSQIFLILTSRLSDDRDFVGNIRVPRRQKVNVIAKAVAPKSAGHWVTVILEARRGDAFYVNWNHPDGSDALNGFYYVGGPKIVHSCSQVGISGVLNDLGVTPPFTVRDTSDMRVSRLVLSEWRKL